MKVSNINEVRWVDGGLLPVVIRDSSSGAILTVAWASRQALERTLDTGSTWLWSRSRETLWNKGATSGNTQRVVEVTTDCDRDSLIYDVEPSGLGCHEGRFSCFGDEPVTLFDSLEELIRSRRSAMPDGSYTASLFRKGDAEIVRKVGEEAIEVVVAAGHESGERLISEIADLVYHLTVLIVNRQIRWRDVVAELRHRAGKTTKP